VLALDPQDVKEGGGGAKTVTAVDLRVQILVHSRERGLGNVLVVNLPHLSHVGEAVGAHGAEVVAGADELVEAGLVDEMVTGRNSARLARRVDVLLADGAVCPAKVFYALVLALEVRGQTHVAGDAVEEVLPAADPADAAAVAVELRLVLIVKQLALVAKVPAEDGSAVLAGLLDALLVAAVGAHDFGDVVPPEDVVLARVMAEATLVRLPAARGVELALPLVVLAARRAAAVVVAGVVLRDGDHRRRGSPAAPAASRGP